MMIMIVCWPPIPRIVDSVNPVACYKKEEHLPNKLYDIIQKKLKDMVKNLCHDNWHLDTLDLDNLAPTKILWKYLLHYHNIRCSVPYNLVADSSKAKLPPIPHCTIGLSIALRISKIAKSEAQIHSILIEAICWSCLGQVKNCPKNQGKCFCEICGT